VSGTGNTRRRFFSLLVRNRHERRVQQQMTMTFSDEEAAPADLVAETEEIYRDAAAELAVALREIRQGKTSEVKTAVQAVKDLRAALQMVMDERTRVEKLRKHIAGGVRDNSLDFDAARDEIGRRLARLREAGGR
jgi:hypothetical protein